MQFRNDAPIVRRPPELRTRAPLSRQQQRLWLAEQLSPGTPTYNLAYVLRLHGALDTAALRAALNGIVARHESLRTRFVSTDAGIPWQLIDPELELPLPVEDLRAHPDAIREARRRAHLDARTVFDLAKGPLLRVRLLELGAAEHWLLLCVHHIIIDGWSLRVFWRELAALYGASQRREPPPLPGLPLQYADYAHWQRQQSETAASAPGRGDRHRSLADAPRLELPVDRAPQEHASHDGCESSLVLDASLVAALRGVGRRRDATLFMTLVAAFCVLLARHTGEDDVVIGFASAGRRRPELADLIGFFVDTRVLGVDLGGAPRFLELLDRVRRGVREALADDDDAPIDALAETAARQRYAPDNRPFDVFFNMRGRKASATPPVHLGPVDGDVDRTDTGTAKFALSVAVSERADERLEAIFEYATARFDATTIERMQRHWLMLLEAIAADPDRPIARLPMLCDDERALLRAWSGIPPGAGADTSLAALFAAQVRQTPDAPAVVWDEGSLGYQELDRRANALARRLRQHGVARDVSVGVYVERSPELVVAMLAILKAGGVYLPLDPDYPESRLAFVLEETEAPVVITQSLLRTRLPRCDALILCIDRDDAAAEAPADPQPLPGAGPRDLAYLIYTSGSTGRPKGVMIEQRSVASHVIDVRKAFAIGSADCVLQTAPIGFDQSVWQMLVPLLCGARVALPAPEAHRSADEVVAAIARHRVTILRTVPTLLAAIASGPGFAACRSLRLIISAGEPLGGGIVDAIHAQCTADVVNAYGPTETTFVATLHRCPRGGMAPSRVPIGVPLPSASVHLLDAHGEAVPIGAVGEICIGGAGVGRGYWRRPELTSQAFLPDPFRGVPGARLYRTGDRARYRADGTLEFLGRRDHLVKIRGFRVELGEIDAALAACPGITAGIADAAADPAGALRIIAYVVPLHGIESATQAVRGHLARVLPRYMLPSRIVELAAVPLSPNGKVDRARLPAPALAAADASSADADPGDPLLRQVARLWSEVLELAPGPGPGGDDDFFEAGGNSLAAMRLLSRVRQSFGVTIAMRDFFAQPTPAGVAGLVGNLPGARPEAATPAAASPIGPQRRRRTPGPRHG